MPRKTLNLGILAHVDAGKTTLTERLLFTAGVIDELGSVDAGTTRTDTLALERQRGITIRSAVVSFPIDDVTVNLLDTPGHPDFIAEVERVLAVLDGAVLVVSAVEGVQPQTPLLMRALQRLGVPTLVFVNKLDRAGADDERVVREMEKRLAPVVPMGTVAGLGTRSATFTPGADEPEFRARLSEALAERNEEILAAYVAGPTAVPYARLREELADQTKRGLLHPVFFGSAATGAGVQELMEGIAELLPASAGDPDPPLSGVVFKIERGPRGEKIAYAGIRTGTLRTRDRLSFGRDGEAKVTAIRVFDRGTEALVPAVVAGEIAKLWGLADVQVGDRIGASGADATHHFPPPTLEAVVAPTDPDDGSRLRVALAQLAEQDPLIDVRQGSTRGEISVSLYGEVQKEVIQATLAGEFGLDVSFRETTPIYVERPVGRGEAVELLHGEANPFLATIGLRVAPGPVGSGLDVRLDVDPRTIPLYLYKTAESFAEHMGAYVRAALREGLYGWQVTDCVVAMTRCVYSIPDGPPSRRGPPSTAADFRKLTPIVLMHALERAATRVCEPMLRLVLELPTARLGATTAALARLGAAVRAQTLRGELATVEATLPAVRVHDLRRQLPALTGGEGVLETEFGGYEPVAGKPPTRARTTVDPRDRKAYLSSVRRGG